MAYPVVESESAGSANASATTSHTITLPATVSVGARLVAALVCSVNDGTTGGIFTWPAGWTELIDAYQNEWYGVAMTAAWRIADGTEDGGTVTVTSTVTQRSAHKSWSITGAGSVYASTTVGVDGSATSDPPSFSPSPGSKEYLWLAISGMDSYRAVSTYPTSYTNTGYKQSAATSFDNDSTIAWARYTTTAATEDPAAFTWDSADSNLAFVLAVEPAILLPTILTVGTLTPGATVAVTYENYVSVPLTANSTLGGVGITVSGATGSGCNIVVPAESAFLFGGSLAALRFNTNTTLVLANASETDSHTVQVTPASSDQIAARSAAALVNAIDSYNGGLTVATSDDVYQYSDPADSFTPFPATNDFTPLESAFTLYTKFYDVSASSWSGLTTQAFPAEAPPGGGTLSITSTLIAEEPPGSLSPAEVNLTLFGGLDWHKTSRTTANTFDTKSGGSMIGAPADIGSPAWARDVGSATGHPLVTWTDGTELASHTGDRGYDYTTVNSTGKRFTISPAGALVKIYLWAGGWNNVEYKVTVSFSDSSAPPVSLAYTSASDHKFYRYEITAQPAGGAATIQVDFERISGAAGIVGWQAIAVESGTSGAVYSLTSSDMTVTPGQTITATLVGGPFQGAITAAYAIYGAHEIPLAWTVLTPSTTSLTMPQIQEFTADGDAEFLGWYSNFTIRIVAGEESADSANTNQVVAVNAGDYGVVGAGPYNHAPAGAQEGDNAYMYLVSGAGTFTPESLDFTDSAGGSVIKSMVFNVATQKWLATTLFLVGFASMALSAVPKQARRLLRKQA